MSNRAEWVWMPHAGHLIVGRDCRFHLNTCVGNYIVSTVGEYEPDSAIREILAKSRGIELQGRGNERRADWHRKNGYEEIGYGRTYETMVFAAEPDAENACCPFTAASWSNLDFDAYNDAVAAREGHEAMCVKYAGAPKYEEVVDDHQTEAE